MYIGVYTTPGRSRIVSGRSICFYAPVNKLDNIDTVHFPFQFHQAAIEVQGSNEAPEAALIHYPLF